MTHHQEEEKNYDFLFYLVGLVSGIFAGVVINNGFILIPVLGLVGLLFAGFFLNTMVRGRGDA
jgi:uncharacterized membrane protein YeaQ/YmgE (transglycosylase-associated protein family)